MAFRGCKLVDHIPLVAPGIRTFVEEGGFYWFLSALFIAKLLMYLLCFINSKLYQAICAIGFLVIGTYSIPI